MSHQIILPRILQIGAGAAKEVGTIIASLGCSKPLIVTDKMMLELGYIDRIQAHLPASEVYSETVPEPTQASILAGVAMVKKGNFDCIIAVGGGSPIDSAKAMAILGKYGGSMRDYMVPRVVNEPGLPIIAIPTTAGTGSEATRVTIITDEENDEKMLCMGMGFMPTAALVDFELTLSLPGRTTADTGIDALTHAMEAYVSKKANPYSDSQAIQAMGLLAPNLRSAWHDGMDRKAREAMMLGATLAGIAFSNASVALVHGMSRPIGAFFHVPHGLSNAMLLPDITAFSIPAATSRYADCARAMQVAIASDTDKQANHKLMDELIALNEELQVPTPAEFGIDKTRFFAVSETMAEQALASGSPSNNPRIPNTREIVELYQNLW
ncbi:MAG: iron-containing alcohol dehydrogenase [Pseudomonadales bacterium]|nr:iron-containing alcohol dehydrogenase [Pseudomonadales bacterium]